MTDLRRYSRGWARRRRIGFSGPGDLAAVRRRGPIVVLGQRGINVDVLSPLLARSWLTQRDLRVNRRHRGGGGRDGRRCRRRHRRLLHVSLLLLQNRHWLQGGPRELLIPSLPLRRGSDVPRERGQGVLWPGRRHGGSIATDGISRRRSAFARCSRKPC